MWLIFAVFRLIAAATLCQSSSLSSQLALQSQTETSSSQVHPKDLSMLADSIQRFSKDTYRILGQAQSGNMIYSPFSIHAALTMTLVGSPEDSTTFKELRKALELNDISSQSFQSYYAAILAYYKEVKDKNKNGEEGCQWDWRLCDGDPNLDILVGNKIFVQEGLKVKANYSLALRNNFRAGKLKMM